MISLTEFVNTVLVRDQHGPLGLRFVSRLGRVLAGECVDGLQQVEQVQADTLATESSTPIC